MSATGNVLGLTPGDPPPGDPHAAGGLHAGGPPAASGGPPALQKRGGYLDIIQNHPDIS